MFGYRLADILFLDIAPAALSVAEREERRQIASPDQRAEFADDLFESAALDEIEIEPVVLGRDLDDIGVGVADIETDLCGIVEEREKSLILSRVDKNEVMRAVERTLLLGVDGIVGAVALIDPAAFVDAANLLSQSVDAGTLIHPIGVFSVLMGKVGQKSALALYLPDNSFGINIR